MLIDSSAIAYAQGSDTASAKAKFASIFLNYVNSSSIGNTICVADTEAMVSKFRAISNKFVIKSYDGNASGCSMIFVGKSNSGELTNVVSSVGKKSIIVVSDIKDSLYKGAIFELFEDAGKLKFSANIKRAKDNGIKINSKLLERAENTI